MRVRVREGLKDEGWGSRVRGQGYNLGCRTLGQKVGILVLKVG